MIRFRNLLPLLGAALVGAASLGASTPAHAAIIIRATAVDSGGVVLDSVTQPGASNPDGSGVLNFSSVVGNFNITLANNILSTGPGFTTASQTVSITYDGPINNPDKLIIEMLANGFSNPNQAALLVITSNSANSTSGLQASSVTMTSGVIAGNVLALGDPGTTLGNQLGMTTGMGSLGLGDASKLLLPNPASGPLINLVSPFSFYQTYTITGFSNARANGGFTAGSTVAEVVPEPGGIELALTSLPVLAGYGWLRRRKAVPSASLRH